MKNEHFPPRRRPLLTGLLGVGLLVAPGLTQGWAPAANFVQPERADMAGLFAAGQVLALGGSPLIAPKFEVAPVESLVPGGTGWSSLTPLDGPTVRAGAGVDSIGHVIVFGGVDGMDPGGDKGKAYWYDLVEGKKGNVSQRTSAAPADHFAYATDDAARIYSIGGGPGATASAAKPNSAHVEYYDAATNLWTAATPMNAAVADAAALNDGAGHLLVIGGYTVTGALTANVARFDVATSTWSDVAVPDLPVATADHAAALGADGRVYVIGGRTAVGLVSDVWVLDAAFGTWTQGPSLPAARADAAVVLASDDQLYLLGGRDGLGGTGEVLTLFTPTCPSFPGAVPQTQKVWRGLTVELHQTVAGGAPITYRWRKDGVDLFDGPTSGGGQVSGAATDSLVITGAAVTDAGVYELVADNGCGQSIAPPITLEIEVPPALTGAWSFEVLGAPAGLGAAAYGLGDGLVGGSATYPDPVYTSLGHPYLWPVLPGPGNDLTPPNSVGGAVAAIAGGTQAGWYWWPYTVPQQGTGYHKHACVWSGTASSYIDIQPSGWEYGSVSDTDGQHHVGTLHFDDSSTTSDGHYWPASQKFAIKLTPSGDWGSSATCLDAGHQYGSVVHPFATVHAAKWSGTAASFENLNPIGSTWSYISDADDGLQVGRATFGGAHHAGLWSGSAASFIDLNPTGAVASEAVATGGGLQVGSIQLPGMNLYSIVWAGEADNYVDLAAFADSDHPFPQLRDIEVLSSGEIRVTGSAFNQTTQQTDAVLFRMLPKTLTSDVDSLSLSAGGAQNLSLEAGASLAGDLYLVLGSASGTSPGLAVDAVVLPLNVDSYLLLSLSSAGSGLFQGTLGFLDAAGSASASLQLPPASDPALAGLVLNHAGLVFDLAGGTQAVLATNAEPLTLMP